MKKVRVAALPLLAAVLLLGGLLSVAAADQAPATKAAAAVRSMASTGSGHRQEGSHGVDITNLPDYVRPAPGGPSADSQGGHASDFTTFNWAGLVETGSTSYTNVSASWTVPTIQPSGTFKVSATWIGIDGFNNEDLIQTGTEQDTSGGSTSYDAWYEILPAPETPITTITVSAGDEMHASINQNSAGSHTAPGSWTITITDETTSKSFTKTVAYGGSDGQPANSAEWIEEQTGVTPQAPLANFGTAQFSGLAYTTADPSDNVSTLVDMVNSSTNVVQAYPTQPDDTDLTVTYGQPPSQTSPMANPNSVPVATSVTYSASVTTTIVGLPTPTGTVTFSVGSTTLCTATLSSGIASCSSTNAPSGSDTVTAVYSGDKVFTTSTGTTSVTVTPATPGFTTSITAPGSNTVGNTWTDSATVMGDSTGLAPTGSVSFTWCEVVSPNTSCTGTTGGGTAGTVSVPSVSGDNSTFGPSTSVAPSSVGTYCFNASYTAPLGGYYASVAQQSDTECFSVTAATPGFTTSITAPASNSVGNTWTDSATVTGNAAGGAPTGSVSFTWCQVVSPDTSCTGTDGGGTAGTLTVPSVTGNNATFGPSDGVTPSSVGTYCFDASYTAPVGSDYVSVAQQSDTECFTVATSTPGFTTSTTAPGSPTVGNSWTDSATVFGDSTGLAPTGSVSFTWCQVVAPNTSCTGTGGGGTAGTLDTPSVSGDNSTFGPSASVTPSSVGTYCFNASYAASGDYYASVAQQSDTECFSVTAATPGLTTSMTAPGSTSVGNAWTDSATVLGNSTGLAPAGSVSFTWCQVVSPNTSCTGTSGGGTAGTSSVPVDSGDNATFGPSTSVTPPNVGTYCFDASYTAASGGNYVSVAQQSDTECFTVTAATPTLTTSITAPSSTTVGNTWTDSATVTGSTTGGAPSGSVSFTWCAEVSANTPCTGTGGGGTAGTSSSPNVNGHASTFGPSSSVTPSSAGTYCFDASYTGAAGGNYASVAQQSDSECFTVAALPPPPPPPPPPAVSHGYWLVGSDGGIFTFGSAQFYGSTGSLKLQRPVVGIVPTNDRNGYWLDASDGGIFAFGDAGFYGSIPGLGLHPAGSGLPNSLNAPIVGMVPATDGNGYFMVASDGGVFAFGDAHFAGSCPGIGGCSGAAVAVMPDATGNGYWLVTSTGSIYTFGDAPYEGAPGNTGSPVTSAVRTPDGKGYWILTANGTVYPFGDAKNFGSPSGQFGGLDPANAVFATSDGAGYWVASANGTVDNFGDAPNDGGMNGTNLNGSIIAATGW